MNTNKKIKAEKVLETVYNILGLIFVLFSLFLIIFVSGSIFVPGSFLVLGILCMLIADSYNKDVQLAEIKLLLKKE